MKKIEGYDHYFVTNEGKIISTLQNKNGLEIKGSICRGYLRISLWKNRKMNERIYAHRIVAKYYVPNPNNKSEINHIDGNRQNNHPSNLEWVDRSYNIIDSVLKKTHNTTKLTVKEVLEIRRLWKENKYNSWKHMKTLGKQFKVTPHNIYRIINNLTWKFLSDNKI